MFAIKDVPDSRYSGLEITNFLNDFGQSSMIRLGYTGKKKEIAQKLFNHEYDHKEVLTYDQTGYFNWPYAVLMANKEDVAKQFNVEHVAQSLESVCLVENFDISGDIL
ncbi:MAG: hypothetical protein ACK5WS_06135 [Alphaproteobacteria bacterium]|jgi:hypothetical protein|nr:hypothetical protein [Candidatus Jidaibacter sp.]